MLTAHLHLAPQLRMSGPVQLFAPCAFVDRTGTGFTDLKNVWTCIGT